MVSLYQYIQSGRVIRSYVDKLELLRGENEFQHFVSRLSVLNKIDTINLFGDRVYETKIDELKDLLKKTPEQVFQLALDQDSNSYLNELKAVADDDIKRYVYLCRIADDCNVLRRNNVMISGELKQQIYNLFDNETISFMCKTSKREDLRSKEGTIAVNGIGYLLYLWGSDTKTIVKEAFIDLYKYYLEKTESTANRNFVYGLTHCVIDISDFYTKNVNDQISYFRDIYPIGELYDQTVWVISHILGIHTNPNSTLTLEDVHSDMLAELLVVYKLLLNDYPSNKWYDHGYTISRTYQELCNRIDYKYNYIRDHKEKNLVLDLKRNEHTNILFILYSRM